MQHLFTLFYNNFKNQNVFIATTETTFSNTYSTDLGLVMKQTNVDFLRLSWQKNQYSMPQNIKGKYSKTLPHL